MTPALTVGLTGGIAAGKSAVLDRFRELGAVVIDSDEVARSVVSVTTDGLADVVAAFGADVLLPDGSLDRSRLASIVFADDEKRAILESIVHPRVRAEVRRRVAAAPSDAIAVNAVPLLVETGLVDDFDRVIVVEAPVETRLARLAASRGMSRDEGLSRIRAQASDEQRRAVGWRVIENDGTLEKLRERVDEVWADLVAGVPTKPGVEPPAGRG
jgi:dephospho-CoA kinase